MRSKIFQLSVLSFFTVAVFSQQGSYSKITSTLYLYATPYFEKTPAVKDFLVKKFGNNGYQHILKFVDEKNWPAGIRTSAERIKNLSSLDKYRAYFIAELPNKTVLLWAPSKENQHMTGNLRPLNDIFFNVDKNGAMLGSLVSPSFSNTTTANTQPANVKIEDLYVSQNKYSEILNGSRLRKGTINTITGGTEMLRRQLSENLVLDIIKYSDYRNWPVALSNILTLDMMAAEIKKLKAVYVADLPQNLVVLWISLADNVTARKDMLLTRDYYLIFYKDGVKLGRKTFPSGSGLQENKPDAAKNVNLYSTRFTDQLPAIVADYANNFATIKGEKKPGTGATTSYFSKINLQGATEVFLSSGLGTRFSFGALYGKFGSKADARRKFDELVRLVNSCYFTCCKFVEDDLFDDKNMITQSWIPFDVGGKMGTAYARMVLEVEMIKTFDFSGQFKNSNDVWQVAVRVRNY